MRSLPIGDSQGGSYIPSREDISSPKQRKSLNDTFEYKSKRNIWKEIREQDAFLAAEEVVREIKITRDRSNQRKGEQTIQEIRRDDNLKI